MDPVEIAWKGFQVIWPLAGGALAGVVMLRRRERIAWEESAKGHLAKLRHEALAKCLAGLGELYEISNNPLTEEEESESDHRKRIAEPLRAVAAHEFMLPPGLRHEVQKVLRFVGGYHRLDFNEDQAGALCAAVDLYLPPIERRNGERNERAAPSPSKS